MAKRPPIMIGSKKLHECRIDEIVDVCSHPLRKRFDTTAVGPVYQNRDIIKAFDGATERTTSELIAKSPEANEDWSEQFNALRIGEVLGWALQEGIVERVVRCGSVQQHHWRLIHADQQFERIGRGVRQRAIRILNAGAAQAENNKLWAKELKARERRRIKEVAKIKASIVYSMREICRTAPNYDISTSPALAQFIVADIRTLAACRDFIEQGIDDMRSNDAADISNALFRIELEVGRTRPEPTPQASPEALAELEDFSL